MLQFKALFLFYYASSFQTREIKDIYVYTHIYIIEFSSDTFLNQVKMKLELHYLNNVYKKTI